MLIKIARFRIQQSGYFSVWGFTPAEGMSLENPIHFSPLMRKTNQKESSQN